MSTALLITALGMSFVFASILLLWGLMELVVRVLPEKEAGAEVAPPPPPPPEADEHALRERAAVAAVAVALALQAEQPAPVVSHFPLPPTALVSAWQAVRRAQQLTQRGPVR